MKKRLHCVGYYVGPARYHKEIANVGIYVVKGEVEALLSGAASEALGIISFHGESNIRRAPAEGIDPADQVYISKYPTLFTGVGKMKNFKVKFHIDPNIPPVARPVKAPPAPWISNLVLSPKDDGGLRVTVDMREPNKAIMDTGLPIPKAEDIRKELVGCNHFTKLDFRTAF